MEFWNEVEPDEFSVTAVMAKSEIHKLKRQQLRY
jgi:hypothetical protein